MKYWISTGLLAALLSSAWAQPTSKDIFEESLYHEYQQKIISAKSNSHKTIHGLTKVDQSLFVDALWDLVEDGNQEALGALTSLNTFSYSLIDRLRLGILRLKYQRAFSLPEELINELKIILLRSEVDIKIIYTIAAYEEDLLKASHQDIIELAKGHEAYFDIAEDEGKKKELTHDIVADLFHNSPDTTSYMNGEYVKSVKIFLFCRSNRLYPCLMTMRDVYGEAVRNQDGSLWTHEALASSSRGLPSYTRNGNTPMGIFTIDSVMPYADQQVSFGKFRRMILNFVPKSKNEVLLKSLLPESSHSEDWWKSTVTARDVGRNLFRIHGTGKKNQDPTTPYFPFMRTSGCIAQKENSYNDINYKDQRELLDDIMLAMNLTPNFENEVKIKGILYLVDIDDENAPVSEKDLALRGIE